MKGSLTITRNSRDVIRLAVRDEESRVIFLQVETTPENLSLALTGLSEVGVDFTTRGLDVIGKRKIRERREAVMPGTGHSKEEMAEWLETFRSEPGWVIDTYLGSQGSVTSTQDGDTRLRYAVVRYEEVEA